MKPSATATTNSLLQGETKSLLAKLSTPQAQQRATIPKLEGKDAELMTGVFARLKSIYLHLWSSNWTDENQLTIAKHDWLNALRREGFSFGEVSATLDYCADKIDKLPNLPTFIAIARQIRYAEQRKREGTLQIESPEQAEQRKKQSGNQSKHYAEIGRPYLDKLKASF